MVVGGCGTGNRSFIYCALVSVRIRRISGGLGPKRHADSWRQPGFVSVQPKKSFLQFSCFVLLITSHWNASVFTQLINIIEDMLIQLSNSNTVSGQVLTTKLWFLRNIWEGVVIIDTYSRFPSDWCHFDLISNSLKIRLSIYSLIFSQITTEFCTYQDSTAVLVCAKFVVIRSVFFYVGRWNYISNLQFARNIVRGTSLGSDVDHGDPTGHMRSDSEGINIWGIKGMDVVRWTVHDFSNSK